jgi:hypothetical protein
VIRAEAADNMRKLARMALVRSDALEAGSLR